MQEGKRRLSAWAAEILDAIGSFLELLGALFNR